MVPCVSCFLIIIAGITVFTLTSIYALDLYSKRGKYEVPHPNRLTTLGVSKIIIDTDIGADDAVAIAWALEFIKKGGGDIDILGITCVHGNTNLTNVEINVLKLLKVANRTDIPVYGGIDRSIIVTPPGDNFFGNDGLGDFYFPDPPNISEIQSEHAVLAMIRLVKENPGEITLIAIGPLTNIAAAIRLDPTFRRNLKNLFILGGSVDGFGNVSPNVEFNFYIDPEATFIVFNSTECSIPPLYLFPWDTHINYAEIDMVWRINTLGIIPTKMMEFLNKAERIDKSTADVWRSSDSSVMVTALKCDWVKSYEYVHVTPVLGGEFRGGLILDRANVREKCKNTIVIKQVELEEYKTILFDTFSL